LKNVGLKLISLLLALGVWMAVSAPRRERVIDRAFSASISLVSMSPEYVIVTPTSVPEKVTVRLRGRRSDLEALSSRALEAIVDLGWVQQAGEASITLRPQAFNVPEDVEVVSIDPNKFRFRVEELRQRAVPIRPFLIGDVPDGYVPGTPTTEPDRALISGPGSQILSINEVGTERIIMTGRVSTFTQSVAVVSDSPLVRIISPLTTRVTVPVNPEIGPIPQPETGTTGEVAPAQP
jgi:YbbR domain-containing protein